MKKLRYYPVSLDISGRNCLVVGGGDVGTRKVTTLLACGAKITVVSIETSRQIATLANNDSIILKKRAYRSSDQSDMFLVIGATNDEVLNSRISRDAEKHNRLCNIADQPASCNFILPSMVRQGDLVIAISTSGKSPAFAKKLRKDLEHQFGKEYAHFLTLIGAIRKHLLQEAHVPEQHKPIFTKLIQSSIISMIKNKDREGIKTLLADILGSGYQFDALIEKTLSERQVDDESDD